MAFKVQSGGELIDLGPNGALTATGDATLVRRTVKKSVRAATTSAASASVKNGDVMDGVTLSTGDRFLNFVSGALTTDAGIWVVGALSSTRATDAPAGESALGAVVYVDEGNTYRHKTITQGAPRDWDDISHVWRIEVEVLVDPPTGDGDIDRQNIQNAIDALPPAGGTVYLREGTYKISRRPGKDFPDTPYVHNHGIMIRRGVFLVGTSSEGCCLEATSQDFTLVKIGIRTSVRDFDLDSAVNLYVGDDFQSAVDSNPAGTVYYIRAGTHREQQVTPKDGDVFIGEEGAVMSGSRILQDWTSFSGIYRTPVESFQMGLRNGEVAGSGSVSNSISSDLPGIHPEELFVTPSGGTLGADSTWLTQVRSPGDVTSTGMWCIDYTGSPMTVYTYDNWSTYTVELATKPFAFGYTIPSDKSGAYTPDRTSGTPLPDTPLAVPDPYSPGDFYAYKPSQVTIKNLVIEKYATPASCGAIGFFRPGMDWTVESNEVRLCHGGGIKAKGAFIVRGNHVHDNGIEGIGVGDGNTTPDRGGDLPEWGWYGGYGGYGGLIEDNIIAANRKTQINIERGWQAGGGKLSQTFNLTYKNNYVYNNDGMGIWYDFAYGDNDTINNYVDANYGAGILVEITHASSSQRQLVQCNYVRNNGENINYSGVDGANIWISNSPNTHVLQNTIIQHASYGRGVTIGDFSYRNVEGEDIYAYGNRIYENHIFMLGGAGTYGICGGQTDRNKSTFFAFSTNQWKWNHYHVPNTASNHFRWDKSPFSTFPPYTNFSGWQSTYGQDTNGKIDTTTVYEPFHSNCPEYEKAGIFRLKIKDAHFGIRAGEDEFHLNLPPLFAECVRVVNCDIGMMIGNWWSELHNCQAINCFQGIKLYDNGGWPPHGVDDTVHPTNVCSLIHCLISGSKWSIYIRGTGNRVIGCTITNIEDDGYGIYMESDENETLCNYIVGNNIEAEVRWQDVHGIAVNECIHNTVSGNTFDLYDDAKCLEFSSDSVRLQNTAIGNYNRQNSTLLAQSIPGDLDFGGGVRVGNSSSAVNGTIRFNGSVLQVYQSGTWRTITTS